MASTNDNYVLAIESAISGGSVALFRDGLFVSGVSGAHSVSRAEDLLPRMIDILNEAGVDRNELCRIAISIGPGSYTGLRIGIATVMGLCRSLRIDYVGVPLFEAIADFHQNRPSLIALPMGRSDICFSETRSGKLSVVSVDKLKTEIDRETGLSLLAHADLVTDLAEVFPDVVDIGSNLAKYIGISSYSRPKSTSLEPFYVQNPRFG